MEKRMATEATLESHIAGLEQNYEALKLGCLSETAAKESYLFERNELLKQHDELAAALRAIDDDIRTPVDGMEFVMIRRSVMKQAREVLAKVAA